MSVDAIDLDDASADDASADDASADPGWKSERTGVSSLKETHTADTAPASLPLPLLDDAALSSPPPSDVFMRGVERASEPPALPLPLLDAAGYDHSLSRAALIAGRGEPARGPYWEWALLGFCATLLLVVIVLFYRGVPLLQAGPERRAAAVVAARLRPAPPTASAPATPQILAPELDVPSPPAASSTARASEPLPRRSSSKRRSPPTPRASPSPSSEPSTQAIAPEATSTKKGSARDSVRAGLAQELP
jgi:hypothetical protein